MTREDAEISEMVAKRFRRRRRRRAARAQGQARRRAGRREAADRRARGQGVRRFPFDALLVAVGRAANLKGFGLEELGVKTGKTVDVNGLLQTNFPNIYAAGDVAGPYQFTHTASHQAWYAAVNALVRPFWSFTADYRVIPWATFTEPEVARVGLNEQEARGEKHSRMKSRLFRDG